MSQNITSIVNHAELIDKVDFLAAAFAGMDNHKKIRTYMSMGRDVLQAEWMSARGIAEKFGKNYREFLLNEFLTLDQENSIDKLFKLTPIKAFTTSIADELLGIKESDNELFVQIMNDARLEFKDDESALKNVIISHLLSDVQLPPIEEDDAVEVDEAIEGHPVEEFEGIPQDEAVEAVEVEKPVKKNKPAAKSTKENVDAAFDKINRKQERTRAEFSLNIPLNEIISTAVYDYIENESGLLAHVDKRIEAEAAKLKPNAIQVGDRKPVVLHGKLHKEFKECLELSITEQQVFIAGKAGTGKTTLAHQVADALQLPFGFISCTAGMSEAHLLGRMDVNGNYLPALFVTIYENGGVFLFDEVDAADANTMLIINSALANGHLSLPNRKDKPVAKRHKDFYCICAANTWGFGSNEYAGRNILDAAFLDRFAGSRLMVDYDTELEKEISTPYPTLAVAIWQIRKNAESAKMRRVVSTRAIVSGVKSLSRGKTLREYIDRLTTGWSTEEKAKALLNVNF
jgi:cobaltochelatase CobS